MNLKFSQHFVIESVAKQFSFSMSVDICGIVHVQNFITTLESKMLFEQSKMLLMCNFMNPIDTNQMIEFQSFSLV